MSMSAPAAEKRPQNTFSAWAFALVLVLYAAVFGALLLTGRAAQFIEGRFLPMVAVSVLVLALAAALQLAGLLRGGAYAPRTGLPVLILPLVFSLVAAEYRSPLAAARFGKPLDPATFGVVPAPAAPQDGGTAEETRVDRIPDITVEESSLTEENGLARFLTEELFEQTDLPDAGRIEFSDMNYYAYYNEVYDHMESMLGREIAVSGFVHREESLASGEFILARMLLWCCTSDAMMLGFHGRYDRGRIPPEGTWLQVSGRLELSSYRNPHTGEEYPIPSIRIQEIAEIPVPEFEYVFPF